MPSEPWNLDVWPSPSAEAIVRARVLGRARTITRRRLLPVVAALLVTAVMAVSHLPGTESSSRVRAVDSSERELTRVPRGGVGSAPTVEEPVVARPVSRRPSTTVAPPPTEAGGEAAGRAPRDGSLWTDPDGDAMYSVCPIGCSQDMQVDRSESEPALDFVAGDVQCRDGRLHAAIDLLDVRAPLRPHRSGMRPSGIEYLVQVRFDDGNEGGEFQFWILRTESTGAYTVTANVYHFYSPTGSVPVEGAAVEQVGDLLIASIGFAELAETSRTTFPDGRPLAPGSPSTLRLTSFIVFPMVMDYPRAADLAGYDSSPVPLCD